MRTESNAHIGKVVKLACKPVVYRYVVIVHDHVAAYANQKSMHVMEWFFNMN